MPSIILTVLVVLVVLLLFLAALVIFRAVMYGRVPDGVEPLPEDQLAPVENAVVAEHLAAALRLQTVSEEDRDRINPRAFEQMHKLLERTYPRTHATLSRELISAYSLLYTWQGRSTDLEPVALLAHLDVVPANPLEWQRPPFDGAVADGFVWGRGALDLKSSVVAILEAVEGLIKAGYQPERTLYLAFGHDEELGGLEGGRAIAETLEQRGVRLAAVLDEGGMVGEGLVPGVDLPVALVGITEKGHALVDLKVEAQPGHASMPPRRTAVGVLARAITAVENHPMPTRLEMIRRIFAELGAFTPLGLRLRLSNFGLLGGPVRQRLAADPTANAITRTTLAVTRIQGGTLANVLPSQAEALVNCRLVPGDSAETVVEHVRKAINDEAVQISLVEGYTWEAAPMSPTDSPEFKGLSRVIRQIFPEAAVSPYLTLGATDSRHYAPVCDSIYRFSPYLLDRALLKSMHGFDERIQIDSLARMVQFYHQLIKTWTGEE